MEGQDGSYRVKQSRDGRLHAANIKIKHEKINTEQDEDAWTEETISQLTDDSGSTETVEYYVSDHNGTPCLEAGTIGVVEEQPQQIHNGTAAGMSGRMMRSIKPNGGKIVYLLDNRDTAAEAAMEEANNEDDYMEEITIVQGPPAGSSSAVQPRIVSHLKCKVCHQIVPANSLRFLKNHLQTHRQLCKLNCKICPKGPPQPVVRTPPLSVLKAQLNLQNAKSFICSICKIVYSNIKDLRAHIQSHNNQVVKKKVVQCNPVGTQYVTRAHSSSM